MRIRIIVIALLMLGFASAGAHAQDGMPVLKQIIPQGTWPGVNKAIAIRGDWMAMSCSGAFDGGGNRIEIWKKTNGVWALHTTFAQGFSQFRPNQGLCASSLDFDSTATQLIVGDPRFAAYGPNGECGDPPWDRIGICEENFVVFRRTGDVWMRDLATPVFQDVATDVGPCYRRQGANVQIEGDLALVAAPYWSAWGNECTSYWGAVRVFQRRATGWVATAVIYGARPGSPLWAAPYPGGNGNAVQMVGQAAVLLRSPLPNSEWIVVGNETPVYCCSTGWFKGSIDPVGQVALTSCNLIDTSGPNGIFPARMAQDGNRVLFTQYYGTSIGWRDFSADGGPNTQLRVLSAPSDVPANKKWGYHFAAGDSRFVTITNDSRMFVYDWNAQANNYLLRGSRAFTQDAPGYVVSPPGLGALGLDPANAVAGTFIAMSGPSLAVQTDSGAILMYEFFPDCNGNNQSDLAEIAANPLLDCDSTGSLDECEPLPSPPPVPTRSTWKSPLGGSFQDVLNWCRQSPVNTTAIEFGIPFNYGVTLSQTREVKNITVSNGFPTLNFNSQSLTLRSSTASSLPVAEKFLRVGSVAGQPASLGVLGGTTNTAFGEVGSGAGTEGTLIVGPGGKVISTTELCVGCEGDGTLLLQNGGQAVSQKAIIGKSATSTGLATIESDNPAIPSRWTSTLGIDVKNGTLAVNEGGIVDSPALGVILFAGGNLTGSGTIIGPVTNFGSAAGNCGLEGLMFGEPIVHRSGGLAPGGRLPIGGQFHGDYSTIGTLTINGLYQQIAANPDLGTNSGSLLVEIAKDGDEIKHDRIAVNGPATLGGGLFVTLATDPSKEEIDFTGLPVFTATAIDPERPNFDIAFMPALPNGRFVKVDAPTALQGGGGAITISTSDLASLLGFGESANATFDLEPLAAAVGDFDGVNGNDVAVTLKGVGSSGPSANGSLLLLFNDGDGGLDKVVQMPNQLGVGPVGIVAAPLRAGKKVPDLALVNQGSETLQVLHNDGIGNFTTAHVVSTGAGSSPSSIDAVPVFAEEPALAGIFDLVVSYAGAASLEVFYNPGDAAPVPTLTLPAGAGTTAVRGVDIDNNRFFDLVAVNQMGATASVFMRQPSDPKGGGGVVFGDALNLSIGDDPVDLVTGDLDGDGLADITTVNRLSNSVSVLLNRTTTTGEANFAPAVTLPTGGEPQSIVLGDFDQDTAIGEPADLDLALTARATTEPDAPRVIKVLRNDRANGVLALAPADDIVVPGAPKLIVADEFDPVSGADIVSLSLGGAQNLQGGEPMATASLVPSTVKPKCAVADLNCDGTIDANDLAIVLAAWGTNDPAADIDGSGTVDASDLSFILANWGSGGAN
jgi:T5SS/PEP-CTERM-associated repeat protein